MKMMPIVLLFLLAVSAVSSAPKECIKRDQACVRNSECCDGCCHESKCVGYADGCQRSPCDLHSCPPGKTCYLQQVQCVAAQCDPIPACRVDVTDYDYE